MEILYQEKPFQKCTYTQHTNRSFTDCLESYQNGAHKESMILKRNGRIPKVDVVIRFLKVKSAKEIKEVLKNIHRYLRKQKVEAVANLELTKEDFRRPNNRVHSHNLLDDERTDKERESLFTDACLSSGLKKGEFRIASWPLYDGYSYFDYFTKYGYPQKVILFKPKTGLNKFYTVGNWFKKVGERV